MFIQMMNVKAPSLLVECKKEEITDQQFNIAVDQAYSYAVAEGGKYVWTTSRIKNEYYEVPKKSRKAELKFPIFLNSELINLHLTNM